MNNLYDRQDELEEIVRRIDNLVDEIKDEYFINELNELKYEAQDELEEVKEKIAKQEEEEEKEQNLEFERSRL